MSRIRDNLGAAGMFVCVASLLTFAACPRPSPAVPDADSGDGAAGAQEALDGHAAGGDPCALECSRRASAGCLTQSQNVCEQTCQSLRDGRMTPCWADAKITGNVAACMGSCSTGGK